MPTMLRLPLVPFVLLLITSISLEGQEVGSLKSSGDVSMGGKPVSTSRQVQAGSTIRVGTNATAAYIGPGFQLSIRESSAITVLDKTHFKLLAGTVQVHDSGGFAAFDNVRFTGVRKLSDYVVTRCGQSILVRSQKGGISVAVENAGYSLPPRYSRVFESKIQDAPADTGCPIPGTVAFDPSYVRAYLLGVAGSLAAGLSPLINEQSQPRPAVSPF